MNAYIKSINESAPLQLLVSKSKYIVYCINAVIALAAGYGIYLLLTLNVEPVKWNFLISPDKMGGRDALVLLFFGIFILLFTGAIAFFAIKLVFNIIRDGIRERCATPWQPVVQSLCSLAFILITVSYTAEVKSTGLTAYNQISTMFTKSRNIEPEKVEIKSKLLDMVEKQLGGY
ncbi:MAG: hypothetical protein ISR96_06235 [Nitrospira sp.]|nr:hypothetical protein [bacterium]MBL7049093.1 hypothetical protein [Nitrospira sp.]